MAHLLHTCFSSCVIECTEAFFGDGPGGVVGLSPDLCGDFDGDWDGNACGCDGFEVGDEVEVAFAGQEIAHLSVDAVAVFDVGGDGVRGAQVNTRLEVDTVNVKVAHVEIDFDVVVVGLPHEPIDFLGCVERVARMGFGCEDDVVFCGAVAQFDELIAIGVFDFVPGAVQTAECADDDAGSIAEGEIAGEDTGVVKFFEDGWTAIALCADGHQGHGDGGFKAEVLDGFGECFAGIIVEFVRSCGPVVARVDFEGFVTYVAQARERVEDVFRLHCISAVSDFHDLSPLKASADGRRWTQIMVCSDQQFATFSILGDGKRLTAKSQ